MIEYIAPNFQVMIGQMEGRPAGRPYYEVSKIRQIEVFSSMLQPLDRAEIEIDNIAGSSSLFQEYDAVTIKLGYKEKGLYLVFSGTVKDIATGRRIIITAHDRARLLKETTITQAFRDVTYQNIIKFGLKRAGVSQMQLYSGNAARLHYFIADNKSVIVIINLLSRRIETISGKIIYSYFTPEGKFIWDEWKSGELIANLEYGKNIIELRPEPKYGYLKTIMLPQIRPGQLIKVTDQNFWKETQTVRVDSVKHTIAEQGGRTEIQWSKPGN